jgi:hypothetical protein
VEFANMVRKRRITFLLACQTLGQLENIYGQKGSETLLAGMAFQIIFGGCDQRTAQFYSAAAGLSTARDTKKEGRSREQQRLLLTPDEIIRPPQGNCTIFGRYVTAEYATYVIVLARLTRIYEREDVKALAARVSLEKARPRLLGRGRGDRPQARGDESLSGQSSRPQPVRQHEEEQRPVAPIGQGVSRPQTPKIVKPLGEIK